jgi:predicted methyltransferase
MNLITFDIITNFCNYDDMEAINNRKKSEKIGKNRKKPEKIGKRSYARYTDWNTIKVPLS